jgi:hypothetical protein
MSFINVLSKVATSKVFISIVVVLHARQVVSNGTPL